MKSFRKLYWFFSAIIRRHLLVIGISTILSLAFFLNFTKLFQYLPYGQSIYIGRVGNVTLSQLPIDIQHLISDGLTQIDSSGNISPSLAKDWEYNEDEKTYQFRVNLDKKWHDGKLLTSNDIDYNLSDIKINRPNDSTIEFLLKEPFAPFPSVLSQPLFRKTITKQFNLFKRTSIVGTGEYQIYDIKFRGNIIKSLTLKNAEQSLIYKFYPTEEEAIFAFKSGKVDKLEEISNPKELTTWENITVSQTPHIDQYVALFFNTSNPDLSSKTFRQALIYAIPDKEEGKIRALSPISQNSWAYNPHIKNYAFDEQSAKNLLLKEFAANQPPKLELTTTPIYLSTAEKIIKSWKDIGIEADLKIVNYPDTANYQVLLIGQKIPPDPDQYALWHSTQQSTNFTHYNSPRVDKLLEDGRKSLDKEKRKLLYQDFQRFLVEDSPAAFLYYLTTYSIER